MSGFAGMINLDARPVEPSLLESVMDTLAHRGSDGCGFWIGGAAGLGHQALWTTPEASLEALPMEFGGQFVITGDVRLDNREDLLSALGEPSRLSMAAPDGALLAAAYEKWGEDCVEHLLGDFAFAIWDRRARKLFCARDHMGVKPFYYALLPGRRFAFGSEIKTVLSVPGISDAVNEQRIADAFVHLINDPAATYYSQVMRLPAAHCLSLTATVSTRRYWRLNPERELRLKSDQEYAEGFREHFQRAVHCRLRSSHPVGSMLSGGLDSSAVSCVARDWLKARGQPKLQTFSAVFDEVTECDERPYIHTVLEQGHCESNFIVADSLSPLGDAEQIMGHVDEPVSAGNLYVGWNAFRKARQLGVRVVLDGFDGDTTVSHGIARLLELARARRWLKLASELQQGAANFPDDFWPVAWWNWFAKFNPAGKRVDRLWSGVMRRLPVSRAPALTAWNLIDLLNPDVVRRFELRQLEQQPPPPVRCERDRHFQLLEREIMSKNMELLAHTSAAFNVEVRFPFMDVRLIEYCLSLPSDQKMRGRYTRLVMRNGMAGILPKQIQWRPGKSNLGPSFEKGLLKFERDRVRTIIQSEASQLAAYVNLKRAEECLARFQRGAAGENDAIAVWTTVGLALWLRSRRAIVEPFYPEKKGGEIKL
ncbi:MAG: lasso peptide isopeptide bond-forming cyclase [Akkermansiaceae bacterium]|nr:lasso peptide isopeptide bond-forming cyclase [Verrucomicrobiales bacterium]